MTGLRARWNAFSLREQRLILVMLFLAAAVFLWLGIARPVGDALARARADHVIAVERAGAISAAVDAIKRGAGRPVPSLNAPIDQLVGQSAAEAGFTVESSAPNGPDRVAIAIGSARAAALFGWLDSLEKRGVVAETLTVRPGANGTVSARIMFRAVRP